MAILENLRNGIDASALFIASAGALFSIAAALYLTSRKISAEFRYRRVDLTTLYAENLLKRRLELYPKLWVLIGTYGKLLKNSPIYKDIEQTIDLEGLLHFGDDVTQWDNQNGLVLSTHSARACAHLQRAIRAIVEVSKRMAPHRLLIARRI